MKIKTMEDLFLHQLQDMYTAEKKILEALPAVVQEADASDLKQALTKHRDETQNHVRRLEQIFQLIGSKPKGVKCKAIEGILGEANEEMDHIEDKSVCDAAIVSSAQAVEHYEISRYGTLIAWAEHLGHREAMKLLKETLDEEKRTDKMLTKIAEEKVNRVAAA
jgi:ferritin-like metal-binding protein YciE